MSTLPVDTVHVGCVTVPGTGAASGSGTSLTNAVTDGTDVQPASFVTLKVCDPGDRPVTVVLIPVPVTVELS